MLIYECVCMWMYECKNTHVYIQICTCDDGRGAILAAALAGRASRGKRATSFFRRCSRIWSKVRRVDCIRGSRKRGDISDRPRQGECNSSGKFRVINGDLGARKGKSTWNIMNNHGGALLLGNKKWDRRNETEEMRQKKWDRRDEIKEGKRRNAS